MTSCKPGVKSLFLAAVCILSMHVPPQLAWGHEKQRHDVRGSAGLDERHIQLVVVPYDFRDAFELEYKNGVSVKGGDCIVHWYDQKLELLKTRVDILRQMINSLERRKENLENLQSKVRNSESASSPMSMLQKTIRQLPALKLQLAVLRREREKLRVISDFDGIFYRVVDPSVSFRYLRTSPVLVGFVASSDADLSTETIERLRGSKP